MENKCLPLPPSDIPDINQVLAYIDQTSLENLPSSEKAYLKKYSLSIIDKKNTLENI